MNQEYTGNFIFNFKGSPNVKFKVEVTRNLIKGKNTYYKYNFVVDLNDNLDVLSKDCETGVFTRNGKSFDKDIHFPKQTGNVLELSFY